MSSFVPKLAEWGEKVMDRGVGKLEGTTVGRGLLNMVGNQDWELSLHPGGRSVKAMQMEYIRLHDVALKNEDAKLQAIRNWHKSDPNAQTMLPVKTATLGQIHGHLTATGHALANTTGTMLNKQTVGMTQAELASHNLGIARLTALQGSYGANYEHVSPILATMLRDPNPEVVQNAHRIGDIIANQTHDTKELYNVASAGKYPGSEAKTKINKSFKGANKLFAKVGEQTIPTLRENATYTPPSKAEALAHRALDTVMIPFLAIKHLPQFANISSSPLTSIGKTLLMMDKQNMDATVEATGILANTIHSAMYRDILGESGHVAEWTNSPTLGKALARTIHQPGFTWFRRKQIYLTGAVGFHSSIQWAHEFATNGSKIAASRLKEMGIDLNEVLMQKGVLTQEQLNKAVYHFTNDRMFISRGLDRSLWQNSNVWARGAFMYHGFVNSQSSFVRRELLTMAKAGDYKGIAQFAGTMAVLFPALAPLLAGAEKILTTGSPTQAGEEVKSRYQKLFHADSAPEWLENYIALMAHTGAAGVYFNYVKALNGWRLGSALAGPMVGLVSTDATDLYHAGAGLISGEPEKAKPLGRDMLKQLVPVAGSMLAHQLLPTDKELKSEGEPVSHRHGHRHHGRRR